MTALAGALVAATLVVAAIDWFAVARDEQRLEYLMKPLTMVVLIGAALALEDVDGTARTWFVVALVFSLAGDVFLMLPKDLFVPGLASFLVGHLAYIVGLRSFDTSTGGLLIGLLVVVLAIPVLGLRIAKAVHSSDEPELLAPVIAYMAVISAMVVSASATGNPVAIAGAVSFYASDALIAWTRFIADHRWGRPAVMITYHLAQVGLVLSLV
ncbi:lysoplasmalogenase [Actinospongicola halichondriae]|uniref:lysoplasmalogenase n=1 Tax=Actinospongicola halichondriae TaxID=3236844 RepID=UPI003D3A05A3